MATGGSRPRPRHAADRGPGRSIMIAIASLVLLLEVGVPGAAFLLPHRLAADSLPTAGSPAPAASEPVTSPPSPTPSDSSAPTAAASAAPTPTPSPVPPPAPPTITLDQASIAQDTLVNPVVTGRVSTGGAQVVAQVKRGAAWSTEAVAQAGPDGRFSFTLDLGNGELRTDQWRFLSGAAGTAPVAVQRTAVLNPQSRPATRADVQHSWQPDCPDPYTDLLVVDLNYYGFDDRMHRGQAVIHKSLTQEFNGLFQTLIDTRFPIRKLRPIEDYAGDDNASAADDNTSVFNCRKTPLGTYWSEHSHGSAIDINPRENPYNSADEVIPADGKPYLDRSNVRKGMLVASLPFMQYATTHGWRWLTPTDYQHLEW